MFWSEFGTNVGIERFFSDVLFTSAKNSNSYYHDFRNNTIYTNEIDQVLKHNLDKIEEVD